MAPHRVDCGHMLHLSVSDLDDFTDQVVLVTGGSSGVGLEFIKILLSKNVRGVVLADPAPPSPEIADAKQLTYVKTDVTDWDSIQVPFEKAAEVYGTLDMVFANAGVGEMEHLFVTEETGDGKLKAPKYKAMDINTYGIMNTIKLAVHWFRKLGKVKGQTDRPGRIVMTASIAGYETPGLPIYTASKHAVVGLLRSAAMDLHEQFGIPLNVLAPGPMIGTNIVTTFAPRATAHGGQPGVVKGGNYRIPNQTPKEAALGAAVLFQQPFDVHKATLVSYDGVYKEVEGFYRKNSPLRAGKGNELNVPPDEEENWRRLYDCTFGAGPAAKNNGVNGTNGVKTANGVH